MTKTATKTSTSKPKVRSAGAIKPLGDRLNTKQAQRVNAKVATRTAKARAKFRKVDPLPVVVTSPGTPEAATRPADVNLADLTYSQRVRGQLLAASKRNLDDKVALALKNAKAQLRVALFGLEQPNADAISARQAVREAYEALDAIVAFTAMRASLADVFRSTKLD